MKFLNDNFKELEKEMDVNDSNKIATLHDDNLKTSKKENKLNIYVIGTGGAGNNTITRLNQIGIDDVTTIAINTDAPDLYHCQSDEKILIGDMRCKKLGAEGNPNFAKECVKESEDLIHEKLKNGDVIIITCGLGGGTGTGSAPIIAKIAKDAGVLTIAVVTLPFSSERFTRRENAEKGLKNLLNNADSVITFPNDILLEVAPNLSVNNAFMVLDEILARTIKSLTELIKNPSLSLEFADIINILQDSNASMIGMGESELGDQIFQSVHQALNFPLLDYDISFYKGAIINFTSSYALNQKEYEKMVQIVADKLAPKAKIIWASQIDDSLENTIKTTIIVIKNSKNIYQGRWDENNDDGPFKFLNNHYLPDKKFKI